MEDTNNSNNLYRWVIAVKRLYRYIIGLIQILKIFLKLETSFLSYEYKYSIVLILFSTNF